MAESVGEALRAKYGTPVRIDNDSADVIVFRHPSEESARAFAKANGESGRAEQRAGVWVSVVDLSHVFDEVNRKYEASRG